MTASLWAWSNAVYAAPGVADACLLLQDRFGIDVNLMLWAAWRHAQGAPLDAAAARDGKDAIRMINAELVLPLRTVRRAARSHRAEALYAAVKAAELAAERTVQERLAALPIRPAAGETGLAAAARASGGDPSAPGLAAALATLARALAPVAQPALASPAQV